MNDLFNFIPLYIERETRKHQKCGDRCHNAKSKLCKCECGGKNHGKDRIGAIENYFFEEEE